MHHQVLFTLWFFLLPISYTQGDESLMQCFERFECGNLKDLVFPFWKGNMSQLCHLEGFELTGCDDDDDQPPIINIGRTEFRLLFVNHTNQTMTIARNDLWDNICLSNPINNVTLGGYPFLKFSPTNINLTFFHNCQSSLRVQPSAEFQCRPRSFYADDLVDRDSLERFRGACGGGGIQVQVNRSAYERLRSEGNQVDFEPRRTWDLGFDVVVDFHGIFCDKCNSQNGLCDDLDAAQFPSRYPVCTKPGNTFNLKRKLVIGFIASAAGVLITCLAFLCWIQRRRGTGFFKSSFETVKSSSNRSLVIDSKRGDSFSGIHLFTYKELEEATNNFDSEKELGDGGFGTVYYGKLRDGRTVAVKRLYENNFKRVEQFMNEVAILTRLRHQYLVSLYGCTSRHSRELLLVYEYVANGTVADHLHGERAKPGALPWHIRLEIAIETANALRYLHASETIHRDVKTNNILLDNDFHVKVADFGLSRLFPTHVTHVSTAPQGTPGYVDPEYYQCYQLTSKSDVFSFGVVLIELISSKPAVDIMRHRHEINLWNMAITKIQNRALHELVDPYLGFESNEEVRKTITGVAELAFQCLQNEKDTRPTMEQVLDALTGIQNEDYKKEKAEEMDLIRAEEGGLLKSGPLPHSPDSVMIKWLSNDSSSTTTTPSF